MVLFKILEHIEQCFSLNFLMGLSFPDLQRKVNILLRLFLRICKNKLNIVIPFLSVSVHLLKLYRVKWRFWVCLHYRTKDKCKSGRGLYARIESGDSWILFHVSQIMVGEQKNIRFPLSKHDWKLRNAEVQILIDVLLFHFFQKVAVCQERNIFDEDLCNEWN